ncbi:MAG: M18 family aminopeptidase [Parachlamydiaceae bacterium]
MARVCMMKDLIDFLDASPTAWHVVANVSQSLREAGFVELSEGNSWHIRPEQRYFVTRNGSSLCAFITPRSLPKSVRLFASHTDSPSFKLKPHSEIRKHHMIILGVEIYGSPLLNSWLNRDLGIAGRVVYFDGKGKIKESLVRLDRYPLVIPQLAIHLDREVNEKGCILNKQDHLHVLVGLESSFKKNSSLLEDLLGDMIDLKEIISHDLFLYPLEKTRLVGLDDAFVAGYRIDSLSSVHAALHALLNAPDPLDHDIKMTIFWDNEEVGSHTAQGADSPFFNQIAERIINGYQGNREDYFCLVNRSTCLSIDLAHALHPNYVDRHDPYHQPILGKGVVLKNNAQQRYATSARSVLPVKWMAGIKQLPLQQFVGRNDIPCGSTIGPLQASLSGMPTVDIGCGQLSMHSCRELMACQDHIEMCHLLTGLFEVSEWPQLGEK